MAQATDDAVIVTDQQDDPEPKPDEPGGRPDRPPIGRDTFWIVVGAGIACLIMAGAIFIFCAQPGGPGLAGFGTGAVVAGGGIAIGAFFGLLFGVPRLLEQTRDTKTTGVPTQTSSYQANTNFTEISDWLTKIIVGVSLIQLGPIRDQLVALVNALAPGFGTSAAAAPFVAGLLATASVTGFLAGYLLARIYLPRVFNEADVISRVARESRRVAVEAVKQGAFDSSNADAEAIRLVDQALSSSATAQHPSQEALIEAIERASPSTRAALASRAAELRSRTWERDQAVMELTIPVFRALIKVNEGDHYLHGQLGFALKDQRQTDYPGAIAELTRAIELRGDPEVEGWLFYEWNRALARVRIELAKDQPSDKATKDAVVADLTLAFRIPGLRTLALDEADFARGPLSTRSTWPR